jgi:hypothetical protein
MPQRVFVIESEDEVVARNKGIGMGSEMGFKKGFQIATIVWLFVLVVSLFFTINVQYNIPQLSDLRTKMGRQLKAQLPQHSEVIDVLIPDGKIVPPTMFSRN